MAACQVLTLRGESSNLSGRTNQLESTVKLKGTIKLPYAVTGRSTDEDEIELDLELDLGLSDLSKQFEQLFAVAIEKAAAEK